MRKPKDDTWKRVKDRRPVFYTTAIWCGVFVMLAVTVISLIYFIKQLSNTQIEEEEFADYQYHYAFITGNTQEAFYQSVYESARAKGEEEGIYVEYMGKNLAVNYSRADLMRIAIAAGVDGIIVEADESEEMIALIDEAVGKEKNEEMTALIDGAAWKGNAIPVVTVGTDCTGSIRQSFVGISYYNLGQLYGEEVLRLTESKENQIELTEKNEDEQRSERKEGEPYQVTILMKSDLENSSQNIILSGIREVLEEGYIIETAAVNDEFSFSVEESIWDIFKKGDQLPDFLICLDELTTTCAYLAVVDFNKVGDVEIIGYYDSENILDTIEKNIIQATIAVDAVQMGEFCVTALEEYGNTGYVSGYIPVDMVLITTDNIKEYRAHEEKQ